MIQSIFKEIDARMGLWFIPQSNLGFNRVNNSIEIFSITNMKVIGIIDETDSGENITITFSHYGIDSEKLFIPLIKEFFFKNFNCTNINIVENGGEKINSVISIYDDSCKLSELLRFYNIPEDILYHLLSNEERTYIEYIKDKKILDSILNIDKEDINILREVTTNRINVIQSEVDKFEKKNSKNTNYLSNLHIISNEDVLSNLLSLFIQQIDWRKESILF